MGWQLLPAIKKSYGGISKTLPRGKVPGKTQNTKGSGLLSSTEQTLTLPSNSVSHNTTIRLLYPQEAG